jgi:hypothetical protein
MTSFLHRAPKRPDLPAPQRVAPTLEAQPEAARRVVITVPLPSRGVFYPQRQQSVQLSPLSVRQVRNVHAASQSTGAARERTFAGVIQQSLHDFNVFDLTIDDYKFIMYWVRMNSYPSNPMTLTWTYHDGEKTREVTSRVNMSNLDVNSLEPNAEPDRLFAYPTVRDSIDYLAIDDASDKYIAYHSQIMAGEDLAAKVARVQELDADVLVRAKEHLVEFSHGVSEYAKVIDPEGKEPGKIFKIPLSVDLKDFYP